MAHRGKIASRGKVQDRRGSSSVGRVRGVGLVGIVLVLAVGYFGGTDQALDLRDTMQNSTQTTISSSDTSAYDGLDEYELFASTVLGSTNELRKQSFEASDIIYREPQIVLFRGATTSACGGAISQVGPHYCPADETIYLDETFFATLQQRFGAQGGDMAQAYVIAHEVGHHVQYLLGVTEQIDRGDNQASIALELQADCLAGIRAGSIRDIMDASDFDEAIDAAASVGDDHVQKTTAGHIQPESWTHGSSEQRKSRFTKGFETRSFQSCNTFS